MYIIFETPRLYLRQFNKNDSPLIFLLNSDPEVLKYVHEPVLENEEHAERMLENIILPNTKITWGDGRFSPKLIMNLLGGAV